LSKTIKKIIRQIQTFTENANVVLDLVTRRYEMIPAMTPELKEIAHRLRAQTFGDELKYEKIPGPMESDVHDAHADQLLLWDHRRKAAIGCVRIVRAEHQGKRYELPFEELCATTVPQDKLGPLMNTPAQCVEVSRFLILRQFRAGGQEKSTPKAAFIALMAGILNFNEAQGTPHLYAVVERKLQRAMRQVGIPIDDLGAPVEHRGLRYPIHMDVRAIRAALTWSQRFMVFFTGRRMNAHIARFKNVVKLGVAGKTLPADPVYQSHTQKINTAG
jgi:N-acyl amino acid synthase of PEP-CTERM/exosortase system